MCVVGEKSLFTIRQVQRTVASGGKAARPLLCYTTLKGSSPIPVSTPHTSR